MPTGETVSRRGGGGGLVRVHCVAVAPQVPVLWWQGQVRGNAQDHALQVPPVQAVLFSAHWRDHAALQIALENTGVRHLS